MADLNPRDFVGESDAHLWLWELINSPLGRIRAGQLLPGKQRRHLGCTVSEFHIRVHSTLTGRMNWLDPPAEPPETAVSQDPESPSEANLNYWTMRLTPLHDPTPRYSWTRPPSSVDPPAGKDMVFVACNRVGTEEGKFSRSLA